MEVCVVCNYSGYVFVACHFHAVINISKLALPPSFLNRDTQSRTTLLILFIHQRRNCGYEGIAELTKGILL